MKRIILTILALAGMVFSCTSCLFFFGESFASRDSLDNATTNTWIVTPQFSSQSDKFFGNESYPQRPETYVGYQAKGKWQPLPTLTNIVVKLRGNDSVQYSFSAKEILKLRAASGGKLRLVLYDQGLVCMSPAIESFNSKAYQNQNYDKYQLLRNQKSEIFNWTVGVLTNGMKVKN